LNIFVIFLNKTVLDKKQTVAYLFQNSTFPLECECRKPKGHLIKLLKCILSQAEDTKSQRSGLIPR